MQCNVAVVVVVCVCEGGGGMAAFLEHATPVMLQGAQQRGRGVA